MTVTLDNVNLSYPDGDTTIDALRQVSLSAEAGQMLAVTGPSGSGKSSLLAVVAGLVLPTSGSVHIDGTEATSLSRAKLTRLRLDKIGIVFQQPNLLPSLTAAEQLQVTNHMQGRSPRKNRDAADRLLATVGLDRKQHRRPHQLSGGERQRVNIARALTTEPSVLLVDEPTAALDHDRGAQIVDLLAEVTRQYDVATILVTHDTEYLDRADRAVSMRDGALVADVGVA